MTTESSETKGLSQRIREHLEEDRRKRAMLDKKEKDVVFEKPIGLSCHRKVLRNSKLDGK